ncbi:MAG: tRNA (uridine(34)/cytosine(34)/5-carboxymethylaminomethyluridine(34)-2'-O)-methyltransferase TrmL [Halieaceae bacterium]|jgi:tRNA (cytidine/uridine-2'-O-)-methyltransferase|nr:tRNA (uridine(34)/cytosine(34)/5-carboxymethylaminomethyluridine(34)-2'-O)-methyltransferase TrmL [Halieaceae bacterium]
MLHLGLFEPEIPPNTGNIMRLCANTGTPLHLVEPLGFSIDDRSLRRAGLDYHEFAEVRSYPDIDALLTALPEARVWTLSTRGTRSYAEVSYADGDLLLFGPETRGLPQGLIDRIGVHRCLRIPMRSDSRSLNLSNAAALVLYEGLRQQGFPGLA